MAFDRQYLLEIIRATLRHKLLVVLFAVDMLVITLHIVIIGFNPNEQLPRWTRWARLSSTGGIGEIFEYLKSFLAGAVLLRTSAFSPVLIPMALLPIYLTLDNSLSIHERLAATLFPDHQNKGELAVSIGIGVVMAVAAAFAYARANQRERSAILAIGIGVIILGGMSAGIDVIHAVVKNYDFRLGRVLLVVEDGGELIAHSLLLVICLVIWELAAEANQIRSRLSGERYVPHGSRTPLNRADDSPEDL